MTTHTDLVEALKPFAECCDQIADDESDEEWAKFRLLVKDYRRARQALASLTAPSPSGDVAGEALQVACADIADDYMTSENHHPGYVLIPTAKFEAIKNAVEGQINADAPLRRLVERGLEILPEHYANWRHDAARALQVQPAEPFGYFYRSKDGMIGDFLADEYSKLADRYRAEGYEEIPLYASPPQPEREVITLADEDKAVLETLISERGVSQNGVIRYRQKQDSRLKDDETITYGGDAKRAREELEQILLICEEAAYACASCEADCGPVKAINEIHIAATEALATTTHAGEEAEGLREAREKYFVAMVEAVDNAGLSPGFARVTKDEDQGFEVAFSISNEMLARLSTLQPSAGALREALTKIKSYCDAGGRDTSFISETARTVLEGGE